MNTSYLISPPKFEYAGDVCEPSPKVLSLFGNAKAHVMNFIKSAYPHIADSVVISERSAKSQKMYMLEVLFKDKSQTEKFAIFGFVGLNDGNITGISFKTNCGNIMAGGMSYETDLLNANIIASLIILALSSMEIDKANDET